MSELKLWQFILDNLKRSSPVILLCVVESIGSSPGRRGFKMAVTESELSGSIGGGMMEHKFVEMARQQLQKIIIEPQIKRQIHSKSARRDQSGMICSGEQTIAFINLDSGYIETIESLIQSLSRNENGKLEITPVNLTFTNHIFNYQTVFEKKSDNDWSFTEQTGYRNHLYIVGGGHCGLALSSLMNTLDFYIHLFDDRENLNTFSANQNVHEKKVVKDYSGLKSLIPSGENNYVVIMTFGYRSDDTALRAVIENDYKYLGVLGSKTKTDQMFYEWRRDGLPEEKLLRIHSPIGFNINSQTPAEIAVSIASQIIAVKNGSLVN